jgi:LmbE family N-acetylglucosaminyl deacetylase
MTTHRHAADCGPVPDDAPAGTLLGIWAHPDDEAYLSAGLMFRARAAGHRVVVATATRGELGTDDPDEWPTDRLAAARETEMTASLAAVDVHEHHWLGYRDGTLPQVPPGDAVGKITGLISAIRPDTIVTFGPDGMTGHPDHRTVSSWATLAWTASGRRARLWYATLTPEFHREWGALNADPLGPGRRPGSAGALRRRAARSQVRRAGRARIADQRPDRAGGCRTVPAVVVDGIFRGRPDRPWPQTRRMTRRRRKIVRVIPAG